jgi:hypothetical protein
MRSAGEAKAATDPSGSLRAAMLSVLPSGNASRAFTLRFSKAISSWLPSASAVGSSSGTSVSTRILGPDVESTRSLISAITRLRSIA